MRIVPSPHARQPGMSIKHVKWSTGTGSFLVQALPPAPASLAKFVDRLSRAQCLAPKGRDHCVVHMSPLFRTCERCQRGYSLETHCLPSLHCLCGGRMRADAHYTDTPFSAGVAQDFKSLLAGELDDFTGGEVLSTIRVASAARGLTDPRDLLTCDAMLRDTEVEYYLQGQTIDVNIRKRLAKFLCGVSVSLMPYFNVAAVRYLFGAVSALGKHLRTVCVPGKADRKQRGAGMTDGQLVAARALLTETRIAQPHMPANLLMKDAVTALHTAVAQDPEWFRARLAQEHVMRASRRKSAEAKADATLAERLEERWRHGVLLHHPPCFGQS